MLSIILKTRKSVLKLGIACIILSTSFYTAQVFISPIYVICSTGVIFYLAYVLMLGNIRYKPSTIIAIILLIYTILVSGNYPNGALFNLILGLSAYIILTSVSHEDYARSILKLTNKSVWIVIVLISLDTAWRLMHPTAPDAATLSAYEDRNTIFYLYKYGSLMFSDSNTTALIVMQYLFLSTYLKIYHKINSGYKTRQGIMMVLLALSFSRAVILTTMVLLIISTIDRYFSRMAKNLSFLILFAVATIGLIFLSEQDISFQTKFDIFNRAEALLLSENSLLTAVTGIGLDQSSNIIGIAAHNILITYSLELGLLGIFIFLIFLISAYLDAKKTLKYCIAPAIIAGLSYYFYAGAPFFFVPLGIIVLLESRHISSNTKNETLPAST